MFMSKHNIYLSKVRSNMFWKSFLVLTKLMDNNIWTYLVWLVSAIMPQVKGVRKKNGYITPLRQLKWHGWMLYYLKKRYFNKSLSVKNFTFGVSYVKYVLILYQKWTETCHNMNNYWAVVVYQNFSQYLGISFISLIRWVQKLDTNVHDVIMICPNN